MRTILNIYATDEAGVKQSQFRLTFETQKELDEFLEDILVSGIDRGSVMQTVELNYDMLFNGVILQRSN